MNANECLCPTDDCKQSQNVTCKLRSNPATHVVQRERVVGFDPSEFASFKLDKIKKIKATNAACIFTV
jgi:hypothetical protein